MPEVGSNLTPSVGQTGTAAVAALALSTETQKEQNNQSTVFLPRGRQIVLTRIENLGLRTAVLGQEELAGYSEAMWQNRLGLCNSGFIWATIVVVVLLLGASGVNRDKEKNTEKVGAIRKSGQEKKMWKKRKRSRNKKEGEFKIETAPSDDSDPEEIEA